MQTRIYLDNNATTPIDARVVEEMMPYYKEYYGNPSSIHWFGQCAKKALDQAREKVADFIKAKPQEIIFTSSGTEADNLALLGVANINHDEKRNKVIISAIEHHAIFRAAEELQLKGLIVMKAPMDRMGIVDLKALENIVDDKTLLVSVMTANNETGIIQPIKIISEIAHAHGTIMHTDAVQAAGKIDFTAEELGCDLVSLSAHKMYGPKGIGALYLNQSLEVYPILFGGLQERGRRAGTENVAHIVAFGKACELCAQEDHERKKIQYLRDKLELSLLHAIPDAIIHGKNTSRVPNTISISFPSIDAEALVIHLDLNGVAVSTGAACSSGIIEPSHVLMAMNIPKELQLCTIRISLGRFNTESEITLASEIICRAIKELS